MTSAQVQRIGHDPAAFEAFYREYVEVVQRFVARRVGDPHLAADLTADVFLAAIDAAGSYDERRGVPVAWLLGVARNVVNTELRRAAREARTVGRVEGRRLLADDDIERLQQRIDAEREARGLVDAMARLPDGERAVLELVAVDDLTVGEAALALGISPVAARVRLHRARTALRRHTDPTTHPVVPHTLEAS